MKAFWGVVGTAILMVGVAVGVAESQGTGGTVGPKAKGTLVLEVRIKARNIGVHCPNTLSERRCGSRPPRLGALTAGNGGVYDTTGKRIGTALFTNVVAQNRGNGGELFLATVLFADGTLTLQGASLMNPEAENPNSSITGGTGAYAGARGVEVEEEIESPNQREFRIRATLTFIP